jgi:alkylation response protein AidB-like acyl-CoA dehydrogenase
MFRDEVRTWLAENLVGEFASLGASGGPGREHEGFEVRRAWEKLLGAAGWTCLGWPKEHGGREASMEEQVIFNEEYVRAGAPVRVGHFGEGLLGPTLIELGTPAQQQRFLPPILRGDELWCQGYSEPDAGSDLANVKTRAERDGDEWVITGQKVWTSNAHTSDWIFVVARTEAGSSRHAGLSYLLVPMDQPAIEVRPIVQITGTSEFNEVFFNGARTAAENIVGEEGDGWRVAMTTLGFERGVATLGQQVGFQRELDAVIALAQATGAADSPVMRQRLANACIGLKLLRYNALRTMHSIADGTPGPEASVSKLQWATWHRRLGELAMDVQGVASTIAEGDGYDLSTLQRLFLFTRADTIYGGSNEIQRNVIGERALGLPREPR